MSTFITYAFTSSRLGFRNWQPADLEEMAEINADPEVMAFFSDIQTKEQTEAFMERMQKQFSEKGFCYFAVERLDTEEFIGFIGLSEQNFESDFNPCIDIGWRLKRSAWGQGIATEGAKRCLEYAFHDLELSTVFAMAPQINIKSIKIMEKIGMQPVGVFKHPKLKGDKRLEDCVLYEITY